MDRLLNQKTIQKVLPLTLAGALLMAGYELLRTTTSSFFNAQYGAANLPVVTAIVPFVIAFFLYIYGRLLTRFGPRKTLIATTLMSSCSLLLLAPAMAKQLPLASAAAWLIREAYIMILVEQYWSWINSTFFEQESKKYNGIVLAITSIGSILGGLFVTRYAVVFGTLSLYVIGAASILPTAWLANLNYKKRYQSRIAVNRQAREGSAIQVLKSSPLLKRMMMMVVLFQVVSAVSGFAFENEVQNAFKILDEQTAFRGKVFTLMNALSFVCQLLLVPLVLTKVRLRTVLVGMPVAVTGMILFWLRGGLWPITSAYLVVKVLDYSFFRATKEVLYVPLSFAIRFRGKEVVDAFGNRFGKSGVSILILALKQLNILMQPALATIGIISALGWFWSASKLEELRNNELDANEKVQS